MASSASGVGGAANSAAGVGCANQATDQGNSSNNDPNGGEDARDLNSTQRVFRPGWSMETWGNIKPEKPPDNGSDFSISKKLQMTRKQRHIAKRFAASVETPIYGRETLINLLGLYALPPSGSGVRYDPGADFTEYNKVSNVDLGENYMYTIEEHERCRGKWRNIRSEILEKHDQLFEQIAAANLDKLDPTIIRENIASNTALQALRLHQRALSANGFHAFMSLMHRRYENAFDRVLRARKHSVNPDYYHPHDRLEVEGKEDSVARQMQTFTEYNVNSWAMTDREDTSIVYTNTGVQILANDDESLPFDKRCVLEFPAGAPRIDQPGLVDADKAFASIRERNTRATKNHHDWENYTFSQIEELGEKYLGGSPIKIPRSKNRIWEVAFKVKEDPLEATVAFFKDPSIKTVHERHFAAVLNGIKAEVLKESSNPDSPYNKYLAWKRDLALRQLKQEIDKGLRERWYFLLQHIPPIELEPKTTHCAYPYCAYHKGSKMPAGTYRLNFLHKDLVGNHPYWLEEIKEASSSPGRAEDGQMWFCLTCIEDLFNGVGLLAAINDSPLLPSIVMPENLWELPTGKILAEWNLRRKLAAEDAQNGKTAQVPVDVSEHKTGEAYDKPSDSHSRTVTNDLLHMLPYSPSGGCLSISLFSETQSVDEEPGSPQPPDDAPRLKVPGVNPFAAWLHSFIKPEVRHTAYEFYTLNSYEYHALMKWKNMCIRKAMWEIPQNREFCSQIPGYEYDYDFVNFFGDDRLDNHEPCPLIVLGKELNVQAVDKDDISTFEPHDPQPAGTVSSTSNGLGEVEVPGIRILKPLSEIMALIDKRVRDGWAGMEPPYVPQKPTELTAILRRKWPLRSFWEDELKVASDKAEMVARKQVIEENRMKIEKMEKEYGRGLGVPAPASRAATLSNRQARSSLATPSDDASDEDERSSYDDDNPPDMAGT